VNLIAPPDEAVYGVLYRSRGPFYVLKNATGIKAGHPEKPIIGDVLIERSNVAYMEIDQ
jgi:hypothetical protein